MKKRSTDTRKSWKILWKYLSAYRRDLVILSVLGVFSAIANGSVPYIMGKFFDAILGEIIIFGTSMLAMPLWLFLLAVWFGVQMIAVFADWMNERLSQKISEQIYGDYLAGAFAYLLLLPLNFHKNYQSGGINSTLNKAANGLNSITGNIVIDLAPKFLSIIIGMAFAFMMNPTLAIILLVGIAVYIILLFYMVPQAIPLQLRSHQAWHESWAVTGQSIGNIFSVKQYGAELQEKNKFFKKFTRAVTLSSQMSNIWSNISFAQRTIVILTQVLIFVSSVFFIRSGAMTIGELLAFGGYAALVFGPFVILGRNWQTLQNGLVALEDAEKILILKTENYSPVNGVKNFDFTGAIAFENVSFRYHGGAKVLDGISFETKPGEMIALVGESGAGKSTLIDLISGYYFPTTGRVTIDGHSTKRIDLEFLRKHIAIVPQEVALFHDTVKMNIAYGTSRAKDVDIKKAAMIAHADKFIEGFPKKYAQIVGERGIKLSVGQKQRIAIARAILRNPKILILDEPTSALDSETEKYVTEALDRVMEGRTTFVIAHRLSTVRKADKILVLEGGKIIESGTHEELMAIEGGNYRHRYELHVGLV